jgi:hypothetical protein
MTDDTLDSAIADAHDDATIQRLIDTFDRVTYRRDVRDVVQRRRGARRRRVPLVLAVTIAAGTLAAGGIVAARRGLPDPVRYATDVRSSAQADALADDVVTFDEYAAGFQRFADCMQRDGRPLSDVTFDPTTQLYNYSYDGVDDCYDREFYALDLSWQLSDARPRDPAQPDVSAEQIAQACADGGPAPVGVPESAFDQICASLVAGSGEP